MEFGHCWIKSPSFGRGSCELQSPNPNTIFGTLMKNLRNKAVDKFQN